MPKTPTKPNSSPGRRIKTEPYPITPSRKPQTQQTSSSTDTPSSNASNERLETPLSDNEDAYIDDAKEEGDYEADNKPRMKGKGSPGKKKGPSGDGRSGGGNGGKGEYNKPMLVSLVLAVSGVRILLIK